MQTLLDLAREKREEAARVLNAATAAWQQAQNKQSQLEGFRKDYEQRLTQAGGNGISVQQWRDFQAFLTKLDMAVAQQAAEVTRRANIRTEAQAGWMAEERKVKSFETLATRHRQREEAKESKREQKQMDEFANRKAFLATRTEE